MTVHAKFLLGSECFLPKKDKINAKRVSLLFVLRCWDGVHVVNVGLTFAKRIFFTSSGYIVP